MLPASTMTYILSLYIFDGSGVDKNIDHELTYLVAHNHVSRTTYIDTLDARTGGEP